MERTKCWEFFNCTSAKERRCPVYPAHGRMCWLIAGTMCRGQVQGEYAQKIQDCRKCEFYKTVLAEARSSPGNSA